MKILQIAYYYPPMGGAGVQRALKFSKYLPDFGVQPVVLAAHDPGYVGDATLMQEVPPGVRVERIVHRPLLQRMLALRARRASRSTPSASAAPSMRPAARETLLRAYAALQFPDDKAGWARHALAVGRRLIRDEGIELVFSSAPPVSAHALGQRLADEAGLPWVADYRDLWTDNPAYAAPAWRRRLDQRTEATWLRRAAGIVTVTPSWQRMLAERWSRQGEHKPVAFIPNGYDEADFAGLVAARRDGDRVFRLVHTGTFYGARDPGPLLQGLAAYLDTVGAAGPALRVRLVGNIGMRFAPTLQRFDAEHPGVIERVPYLPHRESLSELMAADALLLVVDPDGGPRGAAAALPGKLFEYLRAGKPVLMLGGKDSDAAALVRGHAGGQVVDPSHPERFAEAMRALVDAPLAQAAGGAQIGRFDRRALAGELADFLRRCRAGSA